MILIAVALIFICLAALGCFLTKDNVVNMTFILVALTVVLAVICVIAVKENRIAVKVILDVLTGAIALIFIGRFIVGINGSNNANQYFYIGLTAAVAILLICLNVVKYFYEQGQKVSTRYITYAATFVALSILCKMLGNAISVSVTTNMKLTFIYVPWILSGIVLGPIGGMATAVISDVIGQITIATGGAVNPLTTLSNALFPLATSLMFRFAKKLPDWLNLFIGLFISAIVCTLGIGSYAIYTLYDYNVTMSFFTYIITFRLLQAVVVAINFVLCLVLLPVVKKMKLLERVNQS